MNRIAQFLLKNWVSIAVIGGCAGILVWWIGSAQTSIPDSEKDKPLDRISATDWHLGNVSAPIIVIEYSDYQCPACKRYNGVGEKLVNQFGNQVGFAYRHFPLREIHSNAMVAAQTAEAAGKQGKFWEMATVLFDKQEEWSDVKHPQTLFSAYAQQLGLDSSKLDQDAKSTAIRTLVEADYQNALTLRLNATPTFFVNGQKMNNLTGPDDLIARIELTLQEATASAGRVAQ